MKNIILLALSLNSSFALADGRRYHCECMDNNNGDRTLKIFRSSVQVINLDSSYGKVGSSFIADYDSSYRPRASSSKEKSRYLGNELGNDRQVILEKSLILGAKNGYMQLRGDEDGFWSSTYECTRTK